MKRKLPRKKKSSKFDPYIQEITDCLAAGLSTNKIAEHLDQYFDDIVDANALYGFITSRGLKCRDTRGNKTIWIPTCDMCEHCTEVIDKSGEESVRLCRRSRQLIGNGVSTSPIWCSIRKKVS